MPRREISKCPTGLTKKISKKFSFEILLRGMPKKCAICGKKYQLAWRLVKLRGKYNQIEI